MRKKIITPLQQQTSPIDQEWLTIENLAEVEITSEDAEHPVEFALLDGQDKGWLAAAAGKQTIRLVFTHPQQLRRIWLSFEETDIERTQEYDLRWSPDGGQSFAEIVRQQWNFSPRGATRQTEDYQVELQGVTILELNIIPDISGGEALASLKEWRLA